MPSMKSRRAKRVEARHGLVEEQQLGPLRDGQGERELGPLTPGELARALAGVEAELGDAPLGERAIPPGVEPAAKPQVVGDGQVGVRRGVLGDEPDLGELGRVLRGRRPQHLDGSRARGEQPAARRISVVLPAPFGPTSPTTRPAGNRRVQSDSAHRRRYRLPRPRAAKTVSCVMVSSSTRRAVTARSRNLSPGCDPPTGMLDQL